MFRFLRFVITRILPLVIVVVVLTNFWVIIKTKDRIYSDPYKIPENEVGLVLGTSKKMKGGEDNPFFTYRIQAAAELYHLGKIKKIIVSGVNPSRFYNEPRDMKKRLIALNIPEKDIVLDLGGLRTLDSVVRCKEVFGNNKITIITQRFHNYRALFISEFYHIDAVGYEAREVEWQESIKTLFRECLARTNAVVDLYILNTRPKFL